MEGFSTWPQSKLNELWPREDGGISGSRSHMSSSSFLFVVGMEKCVHGRWFLDVFLSPSVISMTESYLFLIKSLVRARRSHASNNNFQLCPFHSEMFPDSSCGSFQIPEPLLTFTSETFCLPQELFLYHLLFQLFLVSILTFLGHVAAIKFKMSGYFSLNVCEMYHFSAFDVLFRFHWEWSIFRSLHFVFIYILQCSNFFGNWGCNLLICINKIKARKNISYYLTHISFTLYL